MPKPITLPALSRLDVDPVAPGVALQLDAVATGGTVYNAEHASVTTELVLFRPGPDRFGLFARIGDRWYQLASVAPDDPALDEIRQALTAPGPSPRELEKRQQREAELAAREAAEAARKAARGADIRRRAEEAERRRKAGRIVYAH